MPAQEIVEVFDVIERVGLGLVSCVVDLAGHSFDLEREEELAIAALSQQLPDRLIEQATL